jgi:hypothetical protein
VSDDLETPAARLFDEMERADGAPAGYREDSFSFLNRVNQPYWARIRDELERWYTGFPDVDLGLRARFRRPEPAQHFGAWWELYLHRLFGCLGFEVEVEPAVAGGKSDFRMRRGSDSFLLEATTSFSGIVDETRRPKEEAAIFDAIDTARNPNFYVTLDIEARGSQQPPVRSITEPLERWLGGLDPDDLLGRAWDEQEQRALEVRGWELVFRAYPLKPEMRGRPDHRLLGAPPGYAGYVNDRTKLSGALVRKRKQYEPSEPLVIAVLLMSSGTMDLEDIEAALLGPVVYPINPDGQGLGERYRQRSGFWMRGNTPTSTRVSAVLTADNLVPVSVARTWLRLWPNPWAARPLSASLPFPTGTANDAGAVRYDEVEGQPSSILGLPDDWPGPGEPFVRPWTTAT